MAVAVTGTVAGSDTVCCRCLLPLFADAAPTASRPRPPAFCGAGCPPGHHSDARSARSRERGMERLRPRCSCGRRPPSWPQPLFPQRGPRGLPGINIVREAAGYREGVQAQCCARHAPLEAISSGTPSDHVFLRTMHSTTRRSKIPATGGGDRCGRGCDLPPQN